MNVEDCMKRIVSFITVLIFCSLSLLSLACDTHEHNFIEKISEETLASEPTCDSPTKYYKSCKECGELSSTTFSVGRARHIWHNEACVLCNASKSLYITFTEDDYTDKMEFGEYPQSEVKNKSVKSALESLCGQKPTADNLFGWTPYRFYVEEELDESLCYYKDLTHEYVRYRAVYIADYRPARTELAVSDSSTNQLRNGYVKDAIYFFRYDPLVWRILYEDDKAFLMIDNSIDSLEYYHTNTERTIEGKTISPNNYEHSNVRKWLTEDFYNTAFSEIEKGAICLTEVDNSPRSTNPTNNPFEYNGGENPYSSKNTEDKVYLASLCEVTNPEYRLDTHLAGSKTRRFAVTDYAKSLGVGVHSEGTYAGNSYVWTRSPYYCYDFGMQRIDYSGELKLSSNVRHSSIAPLICINIEL